MPQDRKSHFSPFKLDLPFRVTSPLSFIVSGDFGDVKQNLYLQFSGGSVVGTSGFGTGERGEGRQVFYGTYRCLCRALLLRDLPDCECVRDGKEKSQCQLCRIESSDATVGGEKASPRSCKNFGGLRHRLSFKGVEKGASEIGVYSVGRDYSFQSVCKL